MRIEVEQFGDGAFEEEYLAFEFSDPGNTAVLMSESVTQTVVGFTYAVPVGYVDWHRGSESGATAYICDTALDTQHQGMRLVGEMMALLEITLRARGFRFLERDAAVSNNYAAKIERAYRGRIVMRGNEHDSEYGRQVFFRIRL